MVIRGTPKNIENYISVKDDYVIHELNKQDIFPIYIDKNLAYFEDNLKTIALIQIIIEKQRKG